MQTRKAFSKRLKPKQKKNCKTFRRKYTHKCKHNNCKVCNAKKCAQRIGG